MRFLSLSLLVSFMFMGLSNGTCQEKGQNKDEVKLDAIKIDCSLLEKTWGLKFSESSFWRKKHEYKMKFMLKFEKDLQPSELKDVRAMFMNQGGGNKLCFWFFDSDMVSTGKFFLPHYGGCTLEAEITGVKGDAVRGTINLNNVSIEWEKTTKCVARAAEQP